MNLKYVELTEKDPMYKHGYRYAVETKRFKSKHVNHDYQSAVEYEKSTDELCDFWLSRGFRNIDVIKFDGTCAADGYRGTVELPVHGLVEVNMNKQMYEQFVSKTPLAEEFFMYVMSN